ncbi:hypothetical protein K432DRAFT_387167 [Lepidopterella palustris CBS 459.81]|uniref:BZIP domain-containing protein n=1 Tax=Lepidopterella palustris CBS 459.81 TaxID=1314670 RepID=A0A8E2J918_9PEZI|nr:hypothetical protein K432DRAFT_387167 [Lepidopterella palustris CBS 459.81]
MADYNGSQAPSTRHQHISTAPFVYEHQEQSQETLAIDEQLAAFSHFESHFELGTMADLSIPIERRHGQEAHAEVQMAMAREDAINAAQLSRADLRFTHFPGFENVVPNLTTTGQEAVHPGQCFHMIPSSGRTSPPPTSLLPPNLSTFTTGDTSQRGASRSSPSSLNGDNNETPRAADEEKRRRNTAASARFRVKKKQREQELEKTAKDLTEKISALEAKVAQYEMENKWLTGLVTEKAQKQGGIDKPFGLLSIENAEAKSAGGRTDGVGTQSPNAEEKDSGA